ncbi:tryptophan 7-halogenase [Rheinheimera baltica]|uniref:Tryptophan 7-halogenase n=1 Tax=Rheinheimera baltica TaxID=67576 RepID=A0ABT9HYM7_9GAMM|nr:tryptophan halogenase family protein [Rheinheimera baltica]MDP5135781.1 tryptophan 7-halogenase [Rheinheimera baltica]MDP5142343.1 tryptophan 7-halogenase [Rheinheimera baltica]
MTSQPLQHIVIAGGGSAGWMTAAMLASQLQGNVQITLVESDDIGTIGVGEATIPPIKRFNAMLGIDEHDFIRRCNGSIKLGIQFENWGAQGDSYFHQFGRFGADFDYIPFPYFYLKAQQEGLALPIQEFSAAWQLAKRNKFVPPNTDSRSLFSGYDYAYHFDAGRYALFLRDYAQQRGVVRIEGRIASVQQHAHNGFIKDLLLDDGQVISGDFFIDCTGLRSVLLGQTLGVGFTDWADYLLNDRAVAMQTSADPSLRPYTRSIAHHAGWQWRIPLQTRMGNGNVYSSRFMADDEAGTLLQQTVEGKPLTDPRFIRFQTGHRQQFWQKNCVAIGLSAGFLEPLESTSLHLIQRGIMRLVSLFPDSSCEQEDIDEYNATTQLEYEQIRDFIVLHYHATTRDDSPYWQYCKHMAIPDSLQQKLALFKRHGHLRIDDKALFKQDSWLAVLLGQHIVPAKAAPVTQFKTELDLQRTLAAMQRHLADTASTLTGHEQYLMQHCRFKPD